MQEKVEYLPVLGHGEFGLEEVLLVLGEDITLEQREVVLNEGSEVHRSYPKINELISTSDIMSW